MDFSLTEQQQMISDSALQFLRDVSSIESVQCVMTSEKGYDSALWKRVCNNLCWPSIHVPECYGGLGLGYVELVLLLDQMGRYLFCSPFYSTVCLASNALLVAGTESQKRHYLPLLFRGELTATLGVTDSSKEKEDRRWGAEAVSVKYDRTACGYQLNGKLRYVVDGCSSQLLIVAARANGSEGKQGISLFVVPMNTEGVSAAYLPTIDQTRKQSEIELSQVFLAESQVMKSPLKAAPLLEQIICQARIALSRNDGGLHSTANTVFSPGSQFSISEAPGRQYDDECRNVKISDVLLSMCC